jgi:hypothetical protein
MDLDRDIVVVQLGLGHVAQPRVARAVPIDDVRLHGLRPSLLKNSPTCSAALWP